MTASSGTYITVQGVCVCMCVWPTSATLRQLVWNDGKALKLLKGTYHGKQDYTLTKHLFLSENNSFTVILKCPNSAILKGS